MEAEIASFLFFWEKFWDKQRHWTFLSGIASIAPPFGLLSLRNSCIESFSSNQNGDGENFIKTGTERISFLLCIALQAAHSINGR